MQYGIQPETRLLTAVVTLALRDLAQKPLSGQMGLEAKSAFRFLFSPSSDGYLEALDIDAPAYRTRLLAMMHDKTLGNVGGFDESDRRRMRLNWKLWSDNYAGLDHPLSEYEEESVEGVQPYETR